MNLKPILAVALLAAALARQGRCAESPHPPVRAVPVPANAALPEWPKPAPAPLSPQALSVRCDNLELIYSSNVLGGFEVRVDGKPMAIGQTHPMIGYVVGEELRWLDLAEAPQRKISVSRERDSLIVEVNCSDLDGGNWILNQRFTPIGFGSSLDIRIGFTCDRQRALAFLPMFMIFPGAGSFGASKGQGLLAGLEYLENEPSSSEADIIGPAANRRVPDNLKMTFPLMAIQSDHRYLALTWQMRPHFCALFDSPDRVFGSGGHVMGILFPGSDGNNRAEGSLLPKVTETLAAGESVVLQATLIGGLGDSVVPAIRQYLAFRPLPPLPVTLDFQKYVSTSAGGWLDSKIRQGPLFRHAVADGGFPPGRAADAAVWMDWLATRNQQPEISSRLRETAREALAGIAAADTDSVGVGHVRYPVASLVYGHVAEAAARAEYNGRALLARFESDFSVKYHPQPGGPDYSKTHSSNEANGFTSRPVLDLLQAASFCGDHELLDAALERLRAMIKFDNGVPRGAQTWECPLHIPDILASAQMVRAYTLGYELTGDTNFLEQARYWAWTGVPFVYLVNPTAQPVGLYSTIAVFGATQWRAPVWLGLPVQWCGLVYADALYWLARDDISTPWKRLADGITASGVQQAWPSSDSDLQGLLPDSFVLRAQHRNGPAINPATLLANAARFYGFHAQPALYDIRCFNQNGLRVHAPGSITFPTEKKGQISFGVESWVTSPYWVLINGLSSKPVLKINDQVTECAAPHQFQEKEGRLILRLEGKMRVALELAR